MTRHVFFIDLSTCAGCQACTIACQNLNELPPEQVFTAISRYETGTFPNLLSTFTVRQCLHCDDPPCAAVCPTGATHKEAAGPVIVDSGRCIDCRYCITACPYGARTADEETRVVRKCSLCYDRLAAGQQPACVETCLTGARMAGDLDNPADPIHQALAQPGILRVAGTSFYVKAPPGIAREALPADFQAAGITFAWQSVLQPASQWLLAGTAAAVLVSISLNALKSAAKGGEDDGGH